MLRTVCDSQGPSGGHYTRTMSTLCPGRPAPFRPVLSCSVVSAHPTVRSCVSVSVTPSPPHHSPPLPPISIHLIPFHSFLSHSSLTQLSTTVPDHSRPISRPRPRPPPPPRQNDVLQAPRPRRARRLGPGSDLLHQHPRESERGRPFTQHGPIASSRLDTSPHAPLLTPSQPSLVQCRESNRTDRIQSHR